MAKLFVRYSRADTTTVDRLVGALEEAGHQVWIDRAGIPGGEIWRCEIVDGIRESEVMQLVLSRHSIESDNVRKELNLAEAEKSGSCQLRSRRSPSPPAYFTNWWESSTSNFTRTIRKA